MRYLRWILRIAPNLVRKDGKPPPVDVIHLHHGVWLNLSQRDITFPGFPERFVAAGEEMAPIRFGEIAPEAGRFAYMAIERAVELAQAGRIDAIVTAPLNKEALNLAGYHYAGHTDMLAALTHTRSSVMLLAHGDMRVGHVTTHVALADVPKLLTPERLRRTIDLTHAAVRDLGIDAPRVAVAALNPHAGEGGLFGRQDIDITAPVVEQCRADGMM